MNSKKNSHVFLAVALACSLAFSSPFNVLADTGYRLVGAGGAQIDFSGGAVIETNDFSSGTAAFVYSNAIKSAMGTSALHQYFMSDNWLPGISSYPLGANAAASALQYNGTGFDKRNAKTGQYSSTTDSWSKPDYTDGKYFLTYRFAGLARVSSSSMEKVTNPKFISDSVFASASNPENNTTVNQGTVYSADGLEVKQSTPVTTYGKGSRIHPFDGETYFYSTGASGWLGTVPAGAPANPYDNHASSFNTGNADVARGVFEDWRDMSDEGAAYWEQASNYLAANQSTLSSYGITQTWQVLNNLFKITGDPTIDGAAVYLYCSFVWISGSNMKNYYNTYQVSYAEVTKNVAPTYLGIVDSSGINVGYASREQAGASLADGADISHSSGTLQLSYGSTYTLDAVESFFSKTRTDSANANRTIGFYAKNTAGERIATSVDFLCASSAASPASVSSAGQSVDGKMSGTVSASRSGASAYYNGMLFKSAFTFTQDLPSSGTLYVTTSDDFSIAGDNEFVPDDVLAVEYSTTGNSGGGSGGGSIPISSDNKGDMNIGLPQYRSLHYIAYEEAEPEEEEDGPGAGSGNGGQQGTTGEPEEPEYIYVHHWSDYGNNTSADIGICDNEEEVESPDVRSESVHNVVINSLIDGSEIVDAWWEYDGNDRFPSDPDYKIWISEGPVTGDYDLFERSESTENKFKIGTTISRSRGEADTISSPQARIWVYGVSPDTDSEGDLLTTVTTAASPNSQGYYTVTGQNSLSTYSYTYAYLSGLAVGNNVLADNGTYYPFLRIVSEVDAPGNGDGGSAGIHGESGIFCSDTIAPENNSWDYESDHAERVVKAKSDDMRILEVEVTDSEGYIIYHADRYDNKNASMSNIIKGYYDREEDLKLRVVIEQNICASHTVVDPKIDVCVEGLNKSGNRNEYCIMPDTTLTSEWDADNHGYATYETYFRPTNSFSLKISASINYIHGPEYWRENIENFDDDNHTAEIFCTTADMSVSQDIEMYNSKNLQQDYLTFGEYLKFKFDIRHIGKTDNQRMVVGNSSINKLPTLNVALYNADALSTNANGKLAYSIAAADPKATKALLMVGDIQSETRLYPGLGQHNYASHVQAWFTGKNPNGYVTQTRRTASGNIAAYGHILVTGRIDEQHDRNGTNIREDTIDYTQKEFKGEKDFSIVDIAVTNRNSASEKTGISVQVAVEDMASSYNDQTVVDKVYIDIYVDDEYMKTTVIEIPVGDTVVTEVIIEEIELDSCKTVEARVNWGEHQTYYEYVLKETNPSLFEDPFVNNKRQAVVCPNLPSEEICPDCVIDGNDTGTVNIWDRVNQITETN